uniref:prolactin-like n=1 Tax=Jaculus jaculus TaxID=51337 RepID=UPI001E1B0E40|nr:prolactin-like [Jaculus jaculus]
MPEVTHITKGEANMFTSSMEVKGKSLLLLVSSLLLWENVASQQMCAMRDGKCQLSLGDLFDRAAMVSQYLVIQSTNVFSEFGKAYFQGWRRFLYRDLNSCHTSNLTTPENKEEAKQMHPEVLLKVIVNMLASWNQSLEHLVKKIEGMKQCPESILSRAKDIDEKYKVLLEGMKTIHNKVWAPVDEEFSNPIQWEENNLNMDNEDAQLSALYNMFYCLSRDSNKINTYVQAKAKEKEDNPVWLGLASLPSVKADYYHFAFHNLFHCLLRDLNKIDTYVKYLKCQIIYPNDC